MGKKKSAKARQTTSVSARRPALTERLLVRMTAEQKEAYLQAALAKNMDLTHWIRLACDTVAAREAQATSKETGE